MLTGFLLKLDILMEFFLSSANASDSLSRISAILFRDGPYRDPILTYPSSVCIIPNVGTPSLFCNINIITRFNI